MASSSSSTASDARRLRSRPPTPRKGLYAYVGRQVVELMSDQQLLGDVRLVLSSLRSIVARPHFHGPYWTTKRRKHGVDMYEFDPSLPRRAVPMNPHGPRRYALTPRHPPSAPTPHPIDLRHRPSAPLHYGFQSRHQLPNPGLDMSFAAVAQCELNCHLDEVMDTLFSDEPRDMALATKALWGSTVQRADLLYSQSVVPDVASPFSWEHRGPGAWHEARGPGQLALKSVTLRSSTLGVQWPSALRKGERLCVTTYTQREPSTSEAFHVVKTLPLDVHDRIACGQTHSALESGSGVDHLAVGYYLKGMYSPMGGHRTKVVVCAYVSSSGGALDDVAATAEASSPALSRWSMRTSELERRSRPSPSVPASARRLVRDLAKAARGFERVVARRRFGQQSFVYFPTDRETFRGIESTCIVCRKRFGLLRRDHYCQLCGHLVCRKCSHKHEIEAVSGAVRENRLCYPCVARVNSCVFVDEELWRDLDRPVILDSDGLTPAPLDAVHARAAIGFLDDAKRERELDGENEYSSSPWDSVAPSLGFDRSYGSTASSSQATTRPELQVAEDLFSPNPRRRADALLALTQAVIAATPTHGARGCSVDPTVVAEYLDKRPTEPHGDDHDHGASSDSKTAVPVAVRSATPASPSSSPSPSSCTLALTVDRSAMDSICEVATSRLRCCAAFVVLSDASRLQHVVGVHASGAMRQSLETTRVDIPIAAMSHRALTIVPDAQQDARLRDNPLIRRHGIRLLACFPIASREQLGIIAALCVADVSRRATIDQNDRVTMQTLCELAADLLARTDATGIAMDEEQKQQVGSCLSAPLASLRDDLQFAIMKAEQLTVLDPRAPPSSKRNPMEIKSLNDVFAVFGYSPEDFIDRHDQCIIFKRIRSELETLLRELSTSTKKYDKAVLLRDRLRAIKHEFIEMQGTYEKRRQDQEQAQFQRGVTLSKARCETNCATRTALSEREIQFKKDDLLRTHAVEREQLESFLRRLPEPHVKFSKLLLELKDTEANLARLKLFEDAKNVYVRADAMEKEERARNTANFEKYKETKRALLRQKHQEEIAELDEKLLEKKYILMRSDDSSRSIESQRVKNLWHDMGHAHTMDLHEKKIFSTNPTPSVRKNHVTSSTLRGQQLLSTVQGKRLEVASLCAIHDSESGTVPHGSRQTSILDGGPSNTRSSSSSRRMKMAPAVRTIARNALSHALRSAPRQTIHRASKLTVAALSHHAGGSVSTSTVRSFSTGHEQQQTAGTAASSSPETRILEHALQHVAAQGWSVEALAAGARDVGYPSVAHGMLPRGAIELVDFYMDKCLEETRRTLAAHTAELQEMSVTDRLKFGIRTRLELMAPVRGTWPQAMAIGALPQNAPGTMQKLGRLADEIWYFAGDKSTDASWYTKRAILTGIYASTELFMLSDESPNFEETWRFLDRRVEETVMLGELPRNINDVAGMMTIGIQSILSAAVSLAGPLSSQIVKSSPLGQVANPIATISSVVPPSVAAGLAAGLPPNPLGAPVQPFDGLGNTIESKDLREIEEELEKLGGAEGAKPRK
ncbi:hypothetical protein ATCC90586_006471 [Pythium insidiosum]|nr:hypothetical protein ATCC90586_006471 [Pythium insidiosum]